MALLTGAFASALDLRPAAAAQWQPAGSLRLLGGQYAFRGARAGVSGDAEFRGALAAVLGDRWSLLGSLDTAYEGTKPLSQPTGGGALFQQRMAHAAGVKAVYAPSANRWRFKPSLRYRLELLRETRDERWFEGLFDSQAVTLGFEGELPFRDLYSLRLGLDYGFVSFPRYRSLEARSPTDFQGGRLARELAGDKVLDHRSQTAYAALSFPMSFLGKSEVDASLSFQRRGFQDQPVVTGDGTLSGTNRVDFETRASARGSAAKEIRRELRLRGAFGLSGAISISNQNRYDADRGEYLARYYNRTEWSLSPSVALELGDERSPVTVRLRLDRTTRAWGRRRAQDASGVYRGPALSQTVWTTGLDLRWPLGTRLSLVSEIEGSWASSNQAYEQYYRYNYGSVRAVTGLELAF